MISRNTNIVSILLIFLLAACGKQTTLTEQGPQLNEQRPQGLMPFRIVNIQQSSEAYCAVYFETTNNSNQTLSMTLKGIFKTPQNQVIDTALHVVKVRSTQTVTDKFLVKERCEVIGSLTLTNTTTCKIDGNFTSDDLCWNQLTPQQGVIPVYK